MSKFFKTRAAVSKGAPDGVKRVQRELLQEIEREVAVMYIAMPFLPKDQVRGIVQKKLGLQQAGKNLLRRGGARIDYKKVSLDFPKSPEEKRATSVESPRNIRKKLLGRSEPFNIIRQNSPVRNHREKEATNDAFGFNQASPIDQTPGPFQRKTPQSLKRRPKKSRKRKLLALSENEDDILLDENENIATVESRTAKQLGRNVCRASPEKQTEEGQPPQRTQTAQIQPTYPEPRWKTLHPVGSDSDEQFAEAGGLTHNSSDDDGKDTSNLQTQRDETSVVGNKEDLLTEDNPSPVLNIKTGKGSRLGRATKYTITKQSENDALKKKSSLLDKKNPGRARLSLSKRSTGNATTLKTPESHHNNGRVPKSVSPKPASAILSVQEQSNTILELPASSEDMLTDAAVVSTTLSDTANTRITPPAGGSTDTRRSLVSETPSEAASSGTILINAECDGSDRFPGSSLSKDEYSVTPQSPITAKFSDYQSKDSFISASLWRHTAATEQDNAEETLAISSSTHGSLKTQERNDSPASSGKSARSSVLFSSRDSVKDHNYSTGAPESAKAVRVRESSPCSLASTPHSTPQSAVFPVRHQPSYILEVPDSPEEMADTAVVPATPSDAARTSITSSTRGTGNTRSGLVKEILSEVNPELDDSDAFPSSSLSKDEYSGTPQFTHQKGMSSYTSASRSLWKNWSAKYQQNRHEEVSKVNRFSQGELKQLEKTNSPASSEMSARSPAWFSPPNSVDTDRNNSSPQIKRAFRPRGASSSCFTTSTPNTVSSLSGFSKTQAENTSEMNDQSLTCETTPAAGQPALSSWRSSSSTPKSPFKILSPLLPPYKRNRSENTASRSPARSLEGSSIEKSTKGGYSSRRSSPQEKTINLIGLRNILVARSMEKDHNYSSPKSVQSVTLREPSPLSSENSPYEPLTLPPYQAWKRGTSENDVIYYSPKRNSSAEISTGSGSSAHRSFSQAETNVSTKTSGGFSTDRDHWNSSQRSVQTVTLREPSPLSSENSPYEPLILPPYPASKRGSSENDVIYYSPKRNSSAEISTGSGSSAHRSFSQAETNVSTKTSGGFSTDRDHWNSSQRSVQTVTPREPSPPSSENSPYEPLILPPYPASKRGSSENDVIYYSPKRNSSAEISTESGSSARRSYSQAETNVSTRTSGVFSADGDHCNSSQRSVQTVTPREPSPLGSEKNTHELLVLPPYPAWKKGSSENDVTYYSPEGNSSAEISTESESSARRSYPLSSSHLSNGKQLRSSSTEDTPLCTRPCRGRSTKKGRSWINQVPNNEITARRLLFQGEHLANSLDCSQGKDSEESAEAQELFSSPVRGPPESQDLFSSPVRSPPESQGLFSSPVRGPPEDGNKHSEDFTAVSRSHISVDLLLLKKGAERLDGLPFPSGEAVRPFSSEWLHQKKLSSLPESPVTVPRPKSPGRFSNVWGSTEAALVMKSTSSQQDKPSQQTSSVLFQEELELMEEPLLATFPLEQSTPAEEQWWKEDSVIRALSQLGVGDIASTGTFMTTQFDVASSEGSSVKRTLPSGLSHESDVQDQDSLMSSQETVCRTCE